MTGSPSHGPTFKFKFGQGAAPGRPGTPHYKGCRTDVTGILHSGSLAGWQRPHCRPSDTVAESDPDSESGLQVPAVQGPAAAGRGQPAAGQPAARGGLRSSRMMIIRDASGYRRHGTSFN